MQKDLEPDPAVRPFSLSFFREIYPMIVSRLNNEFWETICVGLEFENSKYEFPSPDPYRQKEMLLGWVWGFFKVLSKTKSASKNGDGSEPRKESGNGICRAWKAWQKVRPGSSRNRAHFSLKFVFCCANQVWKYFGNQYHSDRDSAPKIIWNSEYRNCVLLRTCFVVRRTCIVPAFPHASYPYLESYHRSLAYSRNFLTR